MRTINLLKTKGELFGTTTNQFLKGGECLFFNECQLAYNTLENAEAEMKSEEFDKEAWTDIVLDNSDPNCQKFFAVYGEGSGMSNSDCIYIEVEADEDILKQVALVLSEY
jgi:hypothetical protein